MASEICAVCGQSRSFHETADVHHLFSTDGKVVPKTKPKPQPANARQHLLAPANEPTAVRLAIVLHSRGIINDDDLVWVFEGGKQPDDTSNSAARDSTTRNLRSRAEASSG